MCKYVWIKNEVPINLEVKQVYGIVFSEEGKILLLPAGQSAGHGQCQSHPRREQSH